ncbi:MAG: hypothetical protein IKT28_03975, partial [Rikenellaceae bacterium]|nr:hypothetical protein [Rikenellaceae bacterium]
MKRYLLLILTALTTVTFAQGQERKLLTMEDAISNPALSPKAYPVKWGVDAKGKTIYSTGAGDKIEWFYPNNGKPAVVNPTDTKAKPVGKPRYFVKENNLYYELDGEKIAITSESNPNIISGSAVSRN